MKKYVETNCKFFCFLCVADDADDGNYNFDLGRIGKIMNTTMMIMMMMMMMMTTFTFNSL